MLDGGRYCYYPAVTSSCPPTDEVISTSRAVTLRCEVVILEGGGNGMGCFPVISPGKTLNSVRAVVRLVLFFLVLNFFLATLAFVAGLFANFMIRGLFI